MGRVATSSLTVAEFCAAEGVSVPAFYQWKRVLAACDTPPLHNRLRPRASS